MNIRDIDDFDFEKIFCHLPEKFMAYFFMTRAWERAIPHQIYEGVLRELLLRASSAAQEVIL